MNPRRTFLRSLLLAPAAGLVAVNEVLAKPVVSPKPAPVGDFEIIPSSNVMVVHGNHYHRIMVEKEPCASNVNSFVKP